MTVKDRILYSLFTHYKIGDLTQLTKKQISYEVATPLRSVNRAISMLSEEGLIAYKKKRFSILFPEKVERYLERVME
jgi:transcription initiation factor IIE alpha subunit